MDEIQKTIGAKIRMYRKASKLSLEELAARVFKSKSILSKYELGESSIDIPTLYSIADELNVDVIHFLDHKRSAPPALGAQRFGLFKSPALYVYMLARERAIPLIKGLITFYDDQNGRTPATFYMGVTDFANYTKCDVVYTGELICHPANAVIFLANPVDPADHTVVFSAIRMNSPDVCMAMLIQSGYNTNEPGALKIILSRAPLVEDSALTERLVINKADISHTRMSNIFGFKPGAVKDDILFQ